MPRGLDDYRCDYCNADLGTSDALDRHDGRHANLDPRATTYPTGMGRPVRTNRVDLHLFKMDETGFTRKRKRGLFNPVSVAA